MRGAFHRLVAALLCVLASGSAAAQSQDYPPDSEAGPPAQAEPAGSESAQAEPAAGRRENPYDAEYDKRHKTGGASVGIGGFSDSDVGASDQGSRESTFEDNPQEEVDDTGHVVPSLGGFEGAEEQVPAPYSVGGIMAQVSDETWFKFYGFLQTRYVTGKHEALPGESVQGSGFSLARARLFFYGRLTSWLRILIRIGANSEGEANFEQAFADFYYKKFTARVGQFYLPVFQEQSLSPVNLLALDFSAVGSAFEGGQTQGVRFSYDALPTRYHLFVTDGLRTGFSEAGASAVADIAITARVESILGEGSYGRFNTGSSFRGEDFAVLLGGGLHYQSGGELREDAEQLASVNGDVTVEGDGYVLHMTASYLNTEGADSERLSQAALVGQAGYFLLDWTEIYGRYEVFFGEVKAATDAEPHVEMFRGLTGGVSHLFWPARGIRGLLDFVYYFDGNLGTPIASNPNAGLFPSYGAQWKIRTEFNVLF